MKPSTSASRMPIAVAWFRKEDWEALVKSADDGDALHDTYEQWHEEASRKYEELKSRGIRVQKVDINIQELIHWCREQQIPLNGAARSRFAASKLRQKSH